MKIGYDQEDDIIYIDTDGHESNEIEVMLCDRIVRKISYGNKSDWAVDKRAANYTTLMYKHNLLVDLKYGPKSRWIAIYVENDKQDDFADHPLFMKKMHTQYVKFNYEGINDLESLVPIIEEGARKCDGYDFAMEPQYCNLVKKY